MKSTIDYFSLHGEDSLTYLSDEVCEICVIRKIDYFSLWQSIWTVKLLQMSSSFIISVVQKNTQFIRFKIVSEDRIRMYFLLVVLIHPLAIINICRSIVLVLISCKNAQMRSFIKNLAVAIISYGSVSASYLYVSKVSLKEIPATDSCLAVD